MTEKAAISPKLEHLHSLPPLLSLRAKLVIFRKRTFVKKHLS